MNLDPTGDRVMKAPLWRPSQTSSYGSLHLAVSHLDALYKTVIISTVFS